jgi:hypothetical protein
MMNNNYILSITTSILYFAAKVIEIKYRKQDNDNKWVKPLVKDSLLIGVISMCSFLLMEQFVKISAYKSSPDVFVGEPDF